VAHPIQPSVVYRTEDADALDDIYEGRATGYTYAREGHPNADVLARAIDRMERMTGGIVLSSGMAAVTVALLSVVRAGDHVVGADQLYGRSLRLLSEELPRLGIATSTADPTDAAAVEAALRPETRAILIETVSNPTIRVADIEGIAALAHDRGIPLLLDNTFATPRMYRGGESGADVVIHSVTKLLAGHSDATLGYVAARDPDLGERMRALSVTMGFTASPFDCWLAERGLLSFPLRYDRAEATARLLADALAGHPAVRQVLYPGRPEHPDHNRAGTLFGPRMGNMLSFSVQGSRTAANAFIRAARALNFAPTLGDISTTLSHPASSSHRALGAEGRAALGIDEGFFRVSVGCEAPDVLIEEFLNALEA
jgi:cystathionine gamma-synthase